MSYKHVLIFLFILIMSGCKNSSKAENVNSTKSLDNNSQEEITSETPKVTPKDLIEDAKTKAAKIVSDANIEANQIEERASVKADSLETKASKALSDAEEKSRGIISEAEERLLNLTISFFKQQKNCFLMT